MRHNPPSYVNGKPFDPIDLAMLVAGYARAHAASGLGVTIAQADSLLHAATALSDVWIVVGSYFDGVWAYDVAEQVGYDLHDLIARPEDEQPAPARVASKATALAWNIVKAGVIREALARATATLENVVLHAGHSVMPPSDVASRRKLADELAAIEALDDEVSRSSEHD